MKISDDLVIGPGGKSLEKVVRTAKEIRTDGIVIETKTVLWKESPNDK